MHEAAAQRQRAARAENHSMAEETSDSKAMRKAKGDDNVRGDGAGRDENERRRHRRTLEEALGIGDGPTRGRREGDEVTPTATRGAAPNGLELPQAAPPRSREERKRLAEVEESRERCLRLITAKRSAKRDGRSRDSEADRSSGGGGTARGKRPDVWLQEALAADRRRLEERAAEEERETLRREREMLRRAGDSEAIRIKADAGIGEGESRRGMIADGIEAQTLEAVVDQAILVAVKLDADLSMWLRDYAAAGADEGFPEITYLRHVTPHSRARVPSEEAWRGG